MPIAEHLRDTTDHEWISTVGYITLQANLTQEATPWR